MLRVDMFKRAAVLLLVLVMVTGAALIGPANAMQEPSVSSRGDFVHSNTLLSFSPGYFPEESTVLIGAIDLVWSMYVAVVSDDDSSFVPSAELDSDYSDDTQPLDEVPEDKELSKATSEDGEATEATPEDDELVEDEEYDLAKGEECDESLPMSVSNVLELWWYQDGQRRSDKGVTYIDADCQDAFADPTRIELHFDVVELTDAGAWTLRAYQGDAFIQSSYSSSLDVEVETETEVEDTDNTELTLRAGSVSSVQSFSDILRIGAASTPLQFPLESFSSDSTLGDFTLHFKSDCFPEELTVYTGTSGIVYYMYVAAVSDSSDPLAFWWYQDDERRTDVGVTYIYASGLSEIVDATRVYLRSDGVSSADAGEWTLRAYDGADHIQVPYTLYLEVELDPTPEPPMASVSPRSPFMPIVPFGGTIHDVDLPADLAALWPLTEDITIRLTGSFQMSGMLTIPAGRHVTIISDDADEERVLTAASGQRHFQVNAGAVAYGGGLLTLGSSMNEEENYFALVGGNAAPGGSINLVGVGDLNFNAGGRLEMYGGTIRGNTSTTIGGGVHIGNNSIFTMHGGTITNNQVTGTGATHGGGGVGSTASTTQTSRFEMHGGVISNNTTLGGNATGGGGGVLLQGLNTVFEMTGGIIGGPRACPSSCDVCPSGECIPFDQGNISGGHGGGLHIAGVGSSIELNGDAQIIGNNANGNGGGLHITGNGSLLEIISSDVRIRDNEATEGGGLNLNVTAANYIDFTMSGGRIENNRARTNGGGMRLAGGRLTMTGGVIHDNTARSAATGTGAGGGIHLSSHPLSRVFLYTDAAISANVVRNGNGGGINLGGGGGVYLRGGKIIGNIAYGNGGGVSISSGAFVTVTMEDGEISGNTARAVGSTSGNGGGVNISNGIFIMHDGLIADNTATRIGGDIGSGGDAGLGGGIRMTSNGYVDIHAGEISGNVAHTSGGGIHIAAANITPVSGEPNRTTGGGLHIREDVLITENTARDYTGGGITFNGGRLRLFGATISENKSGHDGGGMELGANLHNVRDVEIVGVIFSGNEAGVGALTGRGAGGGINTQNVNVNNTHLLILEDLEFYNNHANSRGGAIRFGAMGDVRLGRDALDNVSDIIMHGNTTGGGGGAIFVSTSFGLLPRTVTLYEGVRLFENTANRGGGVYVGGGSVDMRGAQIYDNTAIDGGGVFLNSFAAAVPGTFTMRPDSVIARNTAINNGGGIRASHGNVTFVMEGGIIGGSRACPSDCDECPADECVLIDQGNTAGNNGGGIHISSTPIYINNGLIEGNTATNHGGGMWIARNPQTNFVTVEADGEFRDNFAGGDGGAIFVEHTRTDNPLTLEGGPHYVYRRLAYISDDAVFSGNVAGGGWTVPPYNYALIPRFDGQLMTNYNINYRTTWRVIFRLHGGSVGSDFGPIAVDPDFTPLPGPVFEQVGAGNVPGYVTLPQLLRPGYTFLGWRHLDSEPERDEFWDGDYSAYIRSNTWVANHFVTGSTAFDAVWQRRAYEVVYIVTGPAPATFTPDYTTLGGPYAWGAEVTVADGLTTTETFNGSVRGTWTFDGWTREGLDAVSGTTFDMPQDDVLLIGTWTFEATRVDFAFFKTGDRLYEDPRVIEMRQGAVFHLYRQVFDVGLAAYVWESVMVDVGGTPTHYNASSDATGRVVFNLPADGVYKIRETTAPTSGVNFPSSGYRLPPAGTYWIITMYDSEALSILPSDPDDYRIPYFVPFPIGTDDDGDYIYAWHVGNLRNWMFEFHKTDQRLYSALQSGNPVTWLQADDFLLSGAHFRLFRYQNPGAPSVDFGMSGLVAYDAGLSGNPYYPWVPVQLAIGTTPSYTVISTGNNDTPIWYNLDPRFTYQLVEVEAPTNFQLPWGQWRIWVDAATQEIEIRYVGDSTVPAFAWIPELGYWFVGNREILILPMTGASIGHLFTILGFSVLLLAMAMGGGTMYAKRAKRGPWKEDDELSKHLQAQGYSCSSCKCGFQLNAEKVACRRYGVVPLGSVCMKFEQAQREQTNHGDV